MMAVILSIIFPGLGQIYYGKILKGIVMLLLAMTPLYLLILVWSVWDAYKLSKKETVSPAFRKEALRSLVIFLIAIPLAATLIFLSGYWLINPYVKKNKTKKEIKEIATAVEQYYLVNKTYPENLNTLILNRPLRKEWVYDAWHHMYIYSVSHNQEGFLIASSGKDGKPGTKDDIKP
jgi:hypothetical protein